VTGCTQCLQVCVLSSHGAQTVLNLISVVVCIVCCDYGIIQHAKFKVTTQPAFVCRCERQLDCELDWLGHLWPGCTAAYSKHSVAERCTVRGRLVFASLTDAGGAGRRCYLACSAVHARLEHVRQLPAVHAASFQRVEAAVLCCVHVLVYGPAHLQQTQRSIAALTALVTAPGLVFLGAAFVDMHSFTHW
jgi:hypothetical protein